MEITYLVKAAKQGDKEALLQLIMSKKDEYYRLAFSYMGNEHDALDVMEEMIIILYEKIHQLKKQDAFFSWSKTILVNCCKTNLRKKQKVILVDNWSEIEEKDMEIDPFLKSQQQLDMKELLLSLNEQQKEAIQLKYIHDLDYQTIASITNVSIGTVKSRIFNGLKKLKERCGGDYNER